jgi:hypothetical protein
MIKYGLTARMLPERLAHSDADEAKEAREQSRCLLPSTVEGNRTFLPETITDMST